MSRNSKNAKNMARARMYSEMRKKGESGPKATQPKHGKKHTYRTNPETSKRLAEAVKAMDERQNKRSALSKVLDGAGSAAE